VSNGFLGVSFIWSANSKTTWVSCHCLISALIVGGTRPRKEEANLLVLSPHIPRQSFKDERQAENLWMPKGSPFIQKRKGISVGIFCGLGGRALLMRMYELFFKKLSNVSFNWSQNWTTYNWKNIIGTPRCPVVPSSSCLGSTGYIGS